ncbi:MAG: hypothetical protein G01um101433_9 [Parcubacteria group bacterium Gr01-1014_33]|nr:MAG: hypothetical protein G01um101433_9 [Parcubacteria group bacterium Gr01-1014_33]
MMKIFVIAKPNAGEERVEKIDETHFRIAVKEPPKNGKANAAIVKALAGYFDVAPSRVKILKGATSKQKLIEIS